VPAGAQRAVTPSPHLVGPVQTARDWAALDPRHGGGHTPTYDNRRHGTGSCARRAAHRHRRSTATATWSLAILRRGSPGGTPTDCRRSSTFTIGQVLHGGRVHVSRRTRTWCLTGVRPSASARPALRPSPTPDRGRQKKLIEDAYTAGAFAGDWRCGARTKPAHFQAIPHPGSSWQPEGHPARQPHEYVRGRHGQGAHPVSARPTGRVRIEGTRTCPNAVLQPVAQAGVRGHPSRVAHGATDGRCVTGPRGTVGRSGLTLPITLPAELPLLRGAVGAG